MIGCQRNWSHPRYHLAAGAGQISWLTTWRGAPDTDDPEEELANGVWQATGGTDATTSQDLKRRSNLSRRRALISMRFRYRL